ncbi:MAG TPA: rod shape-determining protein MreD [Nitrospirota bacterium]|nr:rod shape-determining protein MreD [Nitrospirota bacterium]
MKTRVYLAMLLLIIPVQASLFGPLSLAGIKPDLSLALVYSIGLLTGPAEAAFAGMAVGLVLDIGSASLIGMNAMTKGLIGLGAGLLGRQVLDIASPMNAVFLSAFSLAESIIIALLLQTFYGEVPFFSLFLERMLPQALYTGVLGTLLLGFISRRKVLGALVRRSLLKE